MKLTREQLEAGLDDPKDPYGLADISDEVIQYLAPIFEAERFEHCRRIRIKLNSNPQV